MNKLFDQEKISIIDPSVPAEIMLVEIERLKKFPVPFSLSKNILVNTKRSSPLESSVNRAIKRSIDIVFSLIIILGILSWLIPLLAILIKLDSKGSVFFLQKRNGKNGKLFTCIKFRSMIINAEAHLLAEQENDHRVTKLGKFLRMRHIDEFPQFINVLMGDMSIIGPRPYMTAENHVFEQLFNDYAYRHSVKPGITGFAQSLGNFGATNDLQKLKQRIHLDIAYIQKWSPGMDVKILLRTFRMMKNWF